MQIRSTVSRNGQNMGFQNSQSDLSRTPGYLNRVKVHNKKQLVDLVTKRPAGQSLITVSNHYSCMDDPLMWGEHHLRKKKHNFQQLSGTVFQVFFAFQVLPCLCGRW